MFKLIASELNPVEMGELISNLDKGTPEAPPALVDKIALFNELSDINRVLLLPPPPPLLGLYNVWGAEWADIDQLMASLDPV